MSAYSQGFPRLGDEVDLKIQLTSALRRSVSKYILSIVTVVDIAYGRAGQTEKDCKGKREGKGKKKETS